MLNYFFLKKKFFIIDIKKLIYKFVFSKFYCFYYLYRFNIKFFYKLNKLNKKINHKNARLFRIIYRPHTWKKDIQIFLRFFTIYIKNSWITSRHFFGFPKYNKTRNNHKSSKQLSMYFKNFLLKFVLTRHFKNYNKNDVYLVMHLEFLNKLWYFQWNYEWRKARDRFLEFYWITRKRNLKFGVSFSNKFRVFNFIEKKLKRNKKKFTMPKDMYNIGFYFNFSKKCRKLIMSGKSVKY